MLNNQYPPHSFSIHSVFIFEGFRLVYHLRRPFHNRSPFLCQSYHSYSVSCSVLYTDHSVWVPSSCVLSEVTNICAFILSLIYVQCDLFLAGGFIFCFFMYVLLCARFSGFCSQAFIQYCPFPFYPILHSLFHENLALFLALFWKIHKPFTVAPFPSWNIKSFQYVSLFGLLP